MLAFTIAGSATQNCDLTRGNAVTCRGAKRGEHTVLNITLTIEITSTP